MRNALLLAAFLSILPVATCSPAMAQFGRSDNPNMRNFYMARQQVQIFDDAPQVNDMRTGAGAAQGPAPAVTAPQQLPRAGFSTYMSPQMGGGRGLPTVNNGVPKNLPSTMGGGPVGQKAQSGGKIKAKGPAAGSVPAAGRAPVVAKSYKPYATTPVNTGSSGSLLNSSTNVSGSVLHWNKRRAGY